MVSARGTTRDVVRGLLELTPLLLLVVLALAMSRDPGFAPEGIVAVTAALALFFVARFSEGGALAPSSWATVLSAALAVFLGRLAEHPYVMYARKGPSCDALQEGLDAAFALSVVLFFLRCHDARRSGRWVAFRAGLIALLAGLLVVHYLVLIVSPSPYIDVFAVGIEAIDKFLAHQNPYGAHYTDIYHGAYGYAPLFAYPPGNLYATTAAKCLFGDLRVAYFVAEAATCGVVFFIARRLELGAGLALLFPALWYSLPTTLVVLEQSWVDPLLVLATALAVAAMMRQRWFLAGILLGVHLSTKQYGIVFEAMVFGWLLAGRRWHEARRCALGWLVAVAVIFLPWMIRAPEPLLRDLVVSLAGHKARRDAFTWVAYLWNTRGVLLPFWAQTLVPAAAALGVFVHWLRTRTAAISDLLSGAILVHAAFFLFAKQAFVNYYYYLTFFILLSIMTATARAPGPLPRGALPSAHG